VISLEEFTWLQLITVPRVEEDNDHPDTTRRHLFAALTGAHAELRGDVDGPPGALAFACLRAPGQTRLQYLLGGLPHFPPAPDAPISSPGTVIPVLYPPGSTGRVVESRQVASDLTSIPSWIRCTGEPDALATPEAQANASEKLRSPFDDYVAHLDGSFAWVVVAEPLPLSEIDAELAVITARTPLLRQRENSESHRIELERTQARYRELAKARPSGAWAVHILVGGSSAAQARRAGSLLCSAGDLDEVPYVLLPSDVMGSLGATLSETVKGEHGRSPFMASTELLASIARPPSRELPGIRTVTPLAFDVTPETAESDRHIRLGDVIDGSLRPVDTFLVPHNTLNRHAFICGATGSGKSQTARGLLEALSSGPQPVPWLVVEPAKAEYARMAARLGPDADVLRIRPGELGSPPASLNPLEPEPGFPLQSHADLVQALFLAAFEANEPFPQVLSMALTQVYTRAGWDLVSGRQRPATKPRFRVDDPEELLRPRYPTLGELQSAAREVVDNIGYGKEIAADVRGFVDVRIGSLRGGTPGRFFEGGHPLDIGALLRRNVVLELEPITNDQDKAFLMGAVLIRIVEHLRVRDQHQPADGLSHVLLIEEAHRLLKNIEYGPAAAAVELFASLLAEIRAYGEGVVVVEQIPAKILPDVLKNTALKVMHRLPAKDDRDAVGATMNLLQGQSEAVVTFPPGTAAVTIDGTDRPLLVRMRSGTDRESGGSCSVVPPLSGRRSLLCGGDCLARACDLSVINDAQQIAHTPAVTVWVESVAAALVIGLPPPVPRRHIRSLWDVAGRPTRDLDCALATVVDRAVDARRPYIRPFVDVDYFAHELRTILTTQLGGSPGGVAEADRWKAGYYRYYGAWTALVVAAAPMTPQEQAVAPPHPLTMEWASRGLILEGETLGDQLTEIARHPAFSDGKRAVLGDVDHSGLGPALAALTGSVHPTSAHRAFEYACTGDNLALLLEVVTPLVVDL